MIFDLCEPRADVLKGVTDADFAADLAKVIRGVAPEEYLKPDKFFATTYPTRGLRNLLTNVCGRLTGTGNEVASIFRLDTSYGGGKTHGRHQRQVGCVVADAGAVQCADAQAPRQSLQRGHFPPRYQLRRWQNARPDCVGARRQRDAGRFERIRIY